MNIFFKESFKPGGLFKCKHEFTFKVMADVCNGIIDCIYGSDELLCDIPFINKTGCKAESHFSIFCDGILIPETNNSIGKVLNFNALKKIKIANGFIGILENSFDLVHLTISHSSKYFSKTFPKFPNLIFLSLKNNNLKTISFHYTLTLLQILIISYNPIKSLIFLVKMDIFNLIELDISYTRVQEIHPMHIQGFKQLKKLIITNTPLKHIERESFLTLNDLQVLAIHRTKLQLENYYHIYKHLKNIQNISSDDFRLCCIVWRFIGKHIDCSPKVESFFTCDNLISSSIKRVFYWLLGIAGFFGNISAIFLMILSKSFKQKYQFMLIVGDFLVSVYLLSIAITDVFYGNNYIQNDHVWRSSNWCQFLESIVTFSLLLSNVSMCFITIERYLVVANPFKRSFFITKQLYCSLAGAIVCSLLTILYLIIYKVIRFILCILLKIIFMLFFFLLRPPL